MNSELKQKLITLLEEQFRQSADRVIFDYVVQKKIRSQGYRLQRNFTVSLEGGRKGFVDCLVTSPDGQHCAVEIDRRSPRQRSVRKILSLPAGIAGFVLLRNGNHPRRYSVNGVDVVRATKSG